MTWRAVAERGHTYGELFAQRLREPDVEDYQEARRTLEALDQMRTDRTALAEELERLRALIDWRGQVVYLNQRARELLSLRGVMLPAPADQVLAEFARRSGKDYAKLIAISDDPAEIVERIASYELTRPGA